MDGLKALRPCIHDATAMGEAWKIKHRWGYEELNNNGCLLFVAMTHGGMPRPTFVLAPGGIADSLPDRFLPGMLHVQIAESCFKGSVSSDLR